MTSLAKRGPGWVRLLILLAVLVGIAFGGASRIRSMRDRSEVAELMKRPRTVCAGRFLIDVPEDATVTLSNERIAGFEIETVEESDVAFQEHIVAREYEIAARGPATDGSGGMLEARDFRAAGMTGRTFIHGLNRGYLMKGEQRIDDESVIVETHAHVQDISVALSAKYAEPRHAREAEALLARLRLRGEKEILHDPGFCTWRALFADPLPSHTAEHVTMHIGLPAHPEIALTFVSMPGGGDDGGLLARVATIDDESDTLESLLVGKVRTGKRSIDGIPGEEVLERIRELNLATTYSFAWESPGVKDDIVQPFLRIELVGGISARPGGKPVDTTLHADAVLALWDSISSTIRVRRSAGPVDRAMVPEAAVRKVDPKPAAGHSGTPPYLQDRQPASPAAPAPSA